MKGIYTIALLIVSNVFMTLAWYGHLKLQGIKGFERLPLMAVIALSWGMAFFEYCAQVPANGGPFSLIQLKVIQEVVSLTIFTVIASMLFHNISLAWNHVAAFICLVLAVYFVFMK